MKAYVLGLLLVMAGAISEQSAVAQGEGTCAVFLGGEQVTAETHAIVLAPEPTVQETHAAEELSDHIGKITGKALPVVQAADAGGKSCFVIGRNPLAAKLGVVIDYDALGVEGTRLRTIGPHLILAGNRRGVLYAVYTFLEDQLGCRWFTADCMTWPTAGRIDIGALDVTFIPALEYRATDYPNSRPPEFAVRNRLNGTQVRANKKWGGKISYKGFVHTFNALVSPEKYFAEHPEYFSEINGVRVKVRTQLCLTNPDVLRIATESVRRWIKESPHASIVSVSQNDWGNWCTCQACAALAEKEESECGPLLHFVNGVADAIADEHPDLIIDTLAYQYTQKPPRYVRPSPNVAVRLCTISCEFNRTLDNSDYNVAFVSDIRDWNKICNRLHIWDYVINYRHSIQPFPNLHVLKPNIEFFIRNGVTGIYEEANYFSKGGELAELRTYIMAKLLWDATYDVDKATDEFCAAYYGPAAEPIQKYLVDIHRLAVSDPEFHMKINSDSNGPFQTPDAIARYRVLFDRAEELVKDDTVRLHRVQVARLPILYTQIAQQADPLYDLKVDALVPSQKIVDISALVKRFETVARKEGVRRVAENKSRGPIDTWLNNAGRGPRRLPVIRLSGGGALTAVIVPGLGGRVLSLTVGDQERLVVSRTPEGMVASLGGYKEFSEIGYRSLGWNDPFTVLKQDGSSVTLQVDLANGLRMNRRYEVDADTPLLRVCSTVSNPKGKKRKACLRVHPCFRLVDAARARLRLGPPGAEERSLAEGATKESELYLRAGERPNGEWALIDRAGRRTVISRFKPDQVETCYLNWTGMDHRANLEFWSPQRILAAGESLTIEHEYEFLQ